MMKLVNIKYIKISSNGATSFSFNCLNSVKQVIFYEKDSVNSQFSIKPTRNQVFQSSSNTSYKSKYKF